MNCEHSKSFFFYAIQYVSYTNPLGDNFSSLVYLNIFYIGTIQFSHITLNW